MEKQGEKKGFIERSSAFMEKLNYGLGAIAIAAAMAAPEFSGPLLAFGALQFAEGAVWNTLKNRRSNKSPTHMLPAAKIH